MAVYTKDGQLTYVDDQGNEYQLFPKTKLANVEGLEAALKGKAPDGFGLGAAMSPVATNLNTTVKNGWFSYGDAAVGRPAYIPYGVVLVSTRSGEVIQKAFGTTDANYSHRINAQRHSSNGGSSWSEWEYENPPMMNGVEYRTTDRHEGKAIYKKLNSDIEWYRVEGSDTWKQQNELMGAAPASHVNDKNNPHGVTIAQIGAAPAGFGLGSVAGADKWNGDANALTKQGWYRLESGTTNGVGASASVRVDGYAETGLTQTAYTRTGFVLQRTCVDGTWGEWEYVNPPVQPGVEYRTTERWYGSSVYTKLVYCGRLATGRNVIAHNLGCEIIRCVGTCDRNGLPYADKDYNGDIGLAVSQNNIVINATSQFNNKVAHVQLWYVK